MNSNLITSICTVTELAKKLNMSRARLYELQRAGVFPPPVYCIYTKRPYYTKELQDQCLEIRQSGIGYNQRPVIFYGKKSGRAKKSKSHADNALKEISDTLKGMGLKTSHQDIKNALATLYPDSSNPVSVNGELIAAVFKYIKSGCQKAV